MDSFLGINSCPSSLLGAQFLSRRNACHTREGHSTAQFSFKFMRDVFCNLHSKKQFGIFTLYFLIIRSGVQFYLNATSHLCGFLHLIHRLVKWTISSFFCIYSYVLKEKQGLKRVRLNFWKECRKE